VRNLDPLVLGFCDASDEFDPTLYDRIQKTIVEMNSTAELLAHITAITA
jgi:hypothetical protein